MVKWPTKLKSLERLDELLAAQAQADEAEEAGPASGHSGHGAMDEFQAMMNDMEANDVFGGRSRAPAEGTEERRQAKREPAQTVDELHQEVAEEMKAFAQQREERVGEHGAGHAGWGAGGKC